MYDDGLDVWTGCVVKNRPLCKQLGSDRLGAPRKQGPQRFTGACTGRGHGAGTVAASGELRFTRRVIVKARIVRLGGKGLGGVKAYLRHLERDGTTGDGGPGML